MKTTVSPEMQEGVTQGRLARARAIAAAGGIEAALALHAEHDDICADLGIEWPCPTYLALIRGPKS